ncbi:MAG: glycosyltransferase family 4 protein [Patescibacteria group bacterium]
MKKNILIITDAYPPELRSSAELMRDLAVAFQKRGHSVSVVTSSVKSGVAEEEGIRVIRVKTLPHHDVLFVLKGISWLLMPRLFWRAIVKKITTCDVVIVHSPPLPLAYTAYKVKKKYGARYILNVQDIFPQNAADLGILKNKPLIKFFERMERRAYASCDAIVTPSEKHRVYLTEKRKVPKEKISIIPHWLNIEPFEKAKNTGGFRKQFGLENKFIVFFGGVMGPSQGLDILLRLGARLQESHPDIVFLVCGDGSEKKRLMETKEREGANNVYFENWAPKEEYRDLLKEMDVGLITLTAKNTTPAVPAKLMGYLAAGLPVLGFLHKESEAHKIIREAGCGETAPYDDEDACLNIILQMYDNRENLKVMGSNGLEYARKFLSIEAVIRQWEKIII